MGIRDWFGRDRSGRDRSGRDGARPEPRASVQDAGGGAVITTQQDLEAAMRGAVETGSGIAVTASTAMKVAAVYACVRVLSGAVATLPLQVKRRVDERTRQEATDTRIWQVINRRPNGWQKPAQFRRMMQAHQLLRGNAYAHIVRSRGEVIELIPLHPDRVEVKQRDDLSIEYVWRRRNGRLVSLRQDEVLHLVGLTLDGVNGVTPITYARETIGLSLAQERHGTTQFRNGLNVGGYLTTDRRLGEPGRAELRQAMEEYQAGGERAGKWMVLEDGVKAQRLTLTAADAEWIESCKHTRSDIAMYFGLPPHMLGTTEKTTSWGTGIEQQTAGFVAYTLEDYLTMWEEACTCDLLPQRQSDLYFRFNRSALVRGDIKTRWTKYAQAMQWGALSPNEVRALEDMNPRDGGDVYYDPPNTAGEPMDEKDPDDEPARSS